MKYQTMALVGVALATLTNKVQSVPCNALVLSGGANHGAWEIGVLWGLAHYGTPTDYYWDVISGISAGAINAAGIAGWKPDEIVEMTEYLSEAWLGLVTADIWVERPGI
jgi:predicted acylesterase/phospholipase RssA